LLLVDDEPNILKTLQRLFFDEDYEIHTAAGGREALEMIDRGLRPTVIISDQRMPGMSGAEFLAEARKKAPDSIRIVLTGYADIAAAVDAINLGGVYRYIVKPWNDDDLRLAVRDGIKRYNLENENRILTRELRQANKDLETLNQELDVLVQVRTAELQKKVRELQGRDEIQQLLLAIHPLEDLLDKVLEVITTVTSVEGGVFLFLNDTQDDLQVVCERRFFKEDFSGRDQEILERALHCALSCTAHGHACRGPGKWPHLYFFPLVKGGVRYGVLALRLQKGRELSEEETASINGFASQALIGIGDAKVHEHLDDIDSSLDDVLQELRFD